MSGSNHTVGHFRSGMPYNRFGSGPRVLVIFQGLMFENKPLTGFMVNKFAEMYDSLCTDYTVYLVNRAPGLAAGSSMKSIADSYAEMIREEFGGPVDVLGVSTGGSIVQHFAADHPGLVRRLVIHSSAHTLAGPAKQGQLAVARFARQQKWPAAYRALMNVSLPAGPARCFLKPFFFLVSLFGGSIFGKPADPSDLIITIEAEDRHRFISRLSKISAPTLVIAGTKDPFYTEALFRETAKGIPNAKLILYPGMGHPASGKQFKADLRAFLLGE